MGVLAAALVPATALAQAPAPPAPPPAPPAAAPPAEVPPEEPVEAAPPPAPIQEAPPPVEPAPLPQSVEPETTAPLPPPAAEEKKEDVFKITTGVGIRTALRLQKPEDPKKLGGFGMDELNGEARFSGQVTDIVGWTLNLTVDGRTPTSGSEGPIAFQAQAMDVIGQLDFTDEFHLWLGRMLTASDRSNFSGAWFMSPWNYPGIYGPYIGPRGTEEIGREVGATIWGNDKSGKFKYYAAVLDLDNTGIATDNGGPKISPLLSGRVQYAFIGSEPGFYSSSTYYGSQDIVSLGVAAQYQKHSTTDPDLEDESLVEINADLLAEFTAKDVGTFTFEGAYYHFDGPVFPVDDAWFGLVSYLTPEPVGIGKIQLLARFQQGFTDPDNISAFDFWASYVIKDYFAKLALGYTHANLGDDVKTNMVQLGFQIQQ